MADEFGSHTQHEGLVDLLRAEIDRDGPITFHRYMDLVLYHPAFGYYRSGRARIGPRGDYITSPELSPLFGALLGRLVADVWERLGSPPEFDLVEIGPGSGALVRDLLRWAGRARPDLGAALRATLVEPGEEARRVQERTLIGLERVRWMDEAPSAIQGVILSNEVPDSFPVHRVTVERGVLRELYVDWDDGFVDLPGPLSDEAVAAPFDRLGFLPVEGATVEVNVDAPRWLRDLGGRLRRGLLLTLDYGYPARELYARWRRQGTLMAFHRHSVVDDLYAHPGEQDLTAHVDFTTLALAGEDAGLTTLGYTTQRDLLNALGLHEAVSAPDLTLEERLARRRAALSLTDSAGLGRVRALAQGRAIDPDPPLRGFEGAPDPRQTLGLA